VARVSVLITTYNHQRFIGDALASVMHQTFRDFDVVVADDGSIDGTLDVVRSFGDEIHVVTGPNIGFPANWARAFSHCKGEFIALLPGDDTWLPEHLSVAVAALDSHPEVAFSYSYNEHVDEELRPVPGESGEPRDYPTGWIDPRGLLPGNFIEGQSVVVRSRAVQAVGGIDSSLLFVDLDLFVSLANRYPIVYTRRTTAQYRTHAGGMSRNKQAMLEARLALYEKHLGKTWSRARQRLVAGAYFTAAYHQLLEDPTNATVALARRNLMHALRIWPPIALQPRYLAVAGAALSGPVWSSRIRRRVGSSRAKPWLRWLMRI
jgi:glycosyltransferase involved in cell wall biosynthesis